MELLECGLVERARGTHFLHAQFYVQILDLEIKCNAAYSWTPAFFSQAPT